MRLCECGKEIIRTGSRGPWPTHCPDCRRTRREEYLKAYRREYAPTYYRERKNRDPEYYASLRRQSTEYAEKHPEKLPRYAAKYNAAHRQENSARNRAWQKANRERVNAHAHKRRARLRGGGGEYTPEQFTAQYKAQERLCFWCGQAIGPKPHVDYHLDHVLPLILGGTNDASNIVATCPNCNARKHCTHPLDWVDKLLEASLVTPDRHRALSAEVLGRL